MADDDIRPPVPPESTTDQLRRELGLLEAELSRRLASAAQLTEQMWQTHKAVDDGSIATLVQRLNDMDKASGLLEKTISGCSVDLEREINHLRSLMEEKFKAVAQQFGERDTRGEQEKKASKEALDAALLAQKESVSQQNDANTTAAAKTELNFTKQNDQTAVLIATLEKSLSDRLTELKERIDRGEGNSTGGRAERDDSRAIAADQRAVVYLAFAVIAVLVSIGSVIAVVLH